MKTINIDKEGRVIFVPIPKTGCISIAHADSGKAIFDPYCGHIPAYAIRKAHPVLWKQCLTFSFVRNPWDRLASFWGYFRLIGPGNPRYAGLNVKMAKRVKDFTGFEQFVDWLKHASIKTDRHAHSQKSWICGKQGIDVDFVGRFENLQSDWDKVCDMAGRTRTCLPHLNRSKHRPYQELYNEKTRRIVQILYVADIQQFDYSF